MAQARTSTAKKRRARAEAIVLPSVRTYRIWTPEHLRLAEQQADAGNIRWAVDITDWILADDKVRGALDGRINALFSRDIVFAPSGDKRRQKKVVKELDAEEDYDVMFPEPEAVLVMYWALLLNFAPGVLRWKILPDHGGRDIPELEFFHPQPFRYDWQSRQWLRQLETGAVEPVEFGDGVWVCHTPSGKHRPWAMGLWRALGRWALLKAYAISDSGRLGESATRNVVEAEAEAPSTKTVRDELADDISSMARDSTIVLPPGFSYKLVQTQASTHEIQRLQIKMADDAIAMTIRNGNLTTNVISGSLAATEVHERQDQANTRRDANGFATFSHCQVLVPWALSNYGNASLAPWPQRDVEPDDNLKEKAETMVQVMDGAAKAQALGYQIDRKKMAEAFRLPFLIAPKGEANTAVVMPPTAAPAPGQSEPPEDQKPPSEQP